MGIVSLIIMMATVWGALALWHRAPWPAASAGVFAMLALAGLAALWRPPAGIAWLPAAALALLFVALGLWWSTIQPSAARQWASPLARMPTASIAGDRITVTNVRNFTWTKAVANSADGPGDGSGEAIAEERWETRDYDLAAVSGVDLFFSYWSGPLIAHLLVSITFDDAAPLTFSIEIRREAGEAYSALAGFFKSYELAIVAADERDIVRLRTDIWEEDVRLYRLNVSRGKARALLLAYAREMNALAAAPRWYGTLGANCSTVAFRLARELWPDLAFDWRVLAPGRAPDYAHEIGALGPLPLDELKRRAAISERARALPPGEDFSAWIRRGVPKPG